MVDLVIYEINWIVLLYIGTSIYLYNVKFNFLLLYIFQQIEEKVWKQIINGASETDSPCWPTDQYIVFIWLPIPINLNLYYYYFLYYVQIFILCYRIFSEWWYISIYKWSFLNYIIFINAIPYGLYPISVFIFYYILLYLKIIILNIVKTILIKVVTYLYKYKMYDCH